MAKKGGKSQTVTQTANVPQFLNPLMQQSAGFSGDVLKQLQGSLSGGLNPLQQQAQQGMVDFANGAGGFLPTAQNELLKTAQGGYLSGEGFDASLQAAMNRINPQLISAFGGRSSGLGQAAQSQAGADAFAHLYGMERQNQLNAASMLPNIGLLGSQAIGQAGDYQSNNLQNLLSMSSGIPSAYSSMFGQTQSQPLFKNKAGGALGGALAGAQLGNMVPGIGTGIGAGLGGLIGLFG